MTEFKISEALIGEIAALKGAGEAINKDYTKISDDNVKTLKTSVSIISQHESIKELLQYYEALVLRDVKDLEDLVEKAREMDNAIASSNKA